MKRQDRRLEMKSLVDKYNQSDQTVRSFCLDHGLKELVFYYWQWQLQSVAASAFPTATVFTQLQIGTSTDRIELYLPSGLHLGISGLSNGGVAALLFELDRQYSS